MYIGTNLTVWYFSDIIAEVTGPVTGFQLSIDGVTWVDTTSYETPSGTDIALGYPAGITDVATQWRVKSPTGLAFAASGILNDQSGTYTPP